MIRRLWAHRHLVSSLVRRQYQLRYRQSLVGVAWAILPPLASLFVATIVFHGVMGVESPEKGVPYTLFTLAALTPWTFFAQSLSAGIPSIITSMQMVTRLPFPRAALPLSMIGTSLIDLGISVIGFMAFAILIGKGVPLTAIWLLLVIGVEIVLIVGVVLLGSAVNVFMRDIRIAVPLVTQLWLFLTPVMYSLESVPHGLRPLYLANPMTGLVEATREVLAYGRPPSVDLLLPAIVGAAAVLVAGVWYFDATESRFADAI
jgi:homopolymeric O-antigen transport system permease protein